jgi:hypothetical protein
VEQGNSLFFQSHEERESCQKMRAVLKHSSLVISSIPPEQLKTNPALVVSVTEYNSSQCRSVQCLLLLIM